MKFQRPLGFAAYSSNASLKKGTYIILYGNDGVHRTVTLQLFGLVLAKVFVPLKHPAWFPKLELQTLGLGVFACVYP